MDHDTLENKLIALYTADEFDEAEREKERAVPWLRERLAANDPQGRQVLELFSSLAGEAVSASNLSDLLDTLVDDGLITRELATELMESSPSNRWS